MPELVRLHISPLTPELLSKIIPASVLPLVSEASFHTIETFPEHSYGYINLPTIEAEKIKKKLNGTILRGSKMKVEEARKKKEMSDKKGDEVPEVVDDGDRKLRKSERKRKRGDGVLPGYELEDERKVKRGWTEPAKISKDKKVKKAEKDVSGKQDRKKKAQQSVYTDKPECLFKTKLPPNVPGKLGKDARGSKKSKRSKDDRETVVHEFENTTKHPTFLRDGSVGKKKKLVKEYDEARGWVDEDDSVVDQAPAKVVKKSTNSKPTMTQKDSTTINIMVTDKPNKLKSKPELRTELDDETSSSGTSSSSEESDSDEDDASVESQSKPMPTLEVSQSSPTTAEPHPLEALFKKPKVPLQNKDVTSRKPDLEVKVPFSFFDNHEDQDNDEHSEDEDAHAKESVEASSKKSKARSLPNLSIPQTPFTQRDRHWRSQRSAAPTPDTAAPSKKTFGSIWNRDDMEDDIDEDEEEDENEGDDQSKVESTPSGKDKGKNEVKDEVKDEKQESEFSKWFWENRGDTNRAWKKRRREAGKEKRQRENKRRTKASG